MHTLLRMHTHPHMHTCSLHTLICKLTVCVQVVAVVCDYFHRQHNLDSVMKIISHDTVLLAEHLMGPQNTFRRLVTEYVRAPDAKHYEVRRWGLELSEYLRELGFKVRSTCSS